MLVAVAVTGLPDAVSRRRALMRRLAGCATNEGRADRQQTWISRRFTSLLAQCWLRRHWRPKRCASRTMTLADINSGAGAGVSGIEQLPGVEDAAAGLPKRTAVEEQTARICWR